MKIRPSERQQTMLSSQQISQLFVLKWKCKQQPETVVRWVSGKTVSSALQRWYFLHILKAMETLVRGEHVAASVLRLRIFSYPDEMFQGLYFVSITLCTNLSVSSILINEGHCSGVRLTRRRVCFPRTIYIKWLPSSLVDITELILKPLRHPSCWILSFDGKWWNPS